MSSVMTAALPAGAFSGLEFNGADPATADLAGAPSALLTGSAGPGSTASTISQWLNGPGGVQADATAVATAAPGAVAGSWAAQPLYIKVLVGLVAVGLVGVGALGLVLPAAEKAAPLAAGA